MSICICICICICIGEYVNKYTKIHTSLMSFQYDIYIERGIASEPAREREREIAGERER